MAFTYKWSDLTDRLAPFIKNIAITAHLPMICDFVSSDIYTDYPWKDALQNIAAGSLSLVDGQQDYSVPTNLWRPTKLSIVRTDVTPDQHREINVADDLDVDLTERSWTAINSACLQAAVGQIRLESAVDVPSGYTLELQGEYQIVTSKVSGLGTGLWFQDHYAGVAFAGLLYYGYKFADDPRAGTVATDGKGRTTYTGQLAEYKALLHKMKASEDYGSNESYYPSEEMGAQRDVGWSYPRIFG